MPNKIKFSTSSVNGSLSKGNAKVVAGGLIAGPTHVTGFYNGITPPVNGYTFYMKKEGFVESGVILFLDAGNKSSYRDDLSSTEWWDLSGYGNDGALINGVTYDGGNTGSFVFDGTNDYVKIDNVIVTSPIGLTIGGWIMKHEIGGASYETALHHGNGTSIGASSYWFGFQHITNNLCATIGGSVVGWSAGLTTTVAQYNTWYHICASWDGSIVKVYINGIYNKQYNLASYPNQVTPTRIGASGDGTGYLVSGKIGEVWIYERGLSESEIQQNYNISKNRFGL